MDLRTVGAGVLWVLGFGGVLAALGYTSWWGSFRQVGLRRTLRRPAVSAAIEGSLAFACAGFSVASRDWWEAVVWLVLAASFAVLGGRTGWQIVRHPFHSPGAGTRPAGEDD